MASIAAAVFDMDGTLVDNMRFHAEAWLEMAARLGIHGLTVERFETGYAGKKNEEIFPDLLGRVLPDDELRRLAGEKESLYRAKAAPHLVEVPGLSAFLDELTKRSVRLAVATAAPPENRELVLDVLRLRGRFEHVVGAEHAKRGKPAPDLYLAAAKLLDVDPAECVAFEDAPNGVLAAVAAGMRCVAVVTTTPAEKLLDAGAFCALERFDSLPPALRAVLDG
jgi:beta-phosphoglucomutase family hydrolase